LHELIQFLPRVEFSDLLDVFLVFMSLRYLLGALQGTRALQILQGVAVIMFMLLVAHRLKLETLIWLLNWFLVSVAVVLPIIFQPELRRALMRLGQQGMLSSSPLAKMEKEELVPLIEELVFASFSLGQARMGALIVLEREIGLKEYIEQGQPIEGLVSSKLLISIFNPKTPLHDGAVIIRGNRIMAAACILDSAHDQEADDRFGTRHRAALSVSSQSDCLVIVVSEETGQIRFAQEGQFSRPVEDEGDIRKLLANYLVTPTQVAARGNLGNPLAAFKRLRAKRS
jgi:diadenylate cyclase